MYALHGPTPSTPSHDRGRFQASRDDLAVYVAFAGAPAAATYPHTARWYNHVTALLGSRCANHYTTA